MKFTYEDLLSGDSIFAKGIGHLRSPKLKELNPTAGVGSWTYNFYLNVLSWDKETFLKCIKLTGGENKTQALLQNEKLNVFDVMTLISFKPFLFETMSFFVTEKLSWDAKARAFFVIDEREEKVGEINRENFEDVRDMMLQLNYINLEETRCPKFSSEEARKTWERVQEYKKKTNLNSSQNKTLGIGNIVSKLCVASAGYNLLNIYELTIFQLYDQFFQCGYLRAMDFNEMAFSNHGGDNFNLQDWLKPIYKN
jgi:hypothetical protein